MRGGREYSVEDSTVKHLIAMSFEEPDSIENRAPLCRSCNASKQGKAVLYWWFISKSKSLSELDIYVLTASPRSAFHHYNLKDEAPLYYKMAITQAAVTMPDDLFPYIMDAARDI